MHKEHDTSVVLLCGFFVERKERDAMGCSNVFATIYPLSRLLIVTK